MKTLKILPLFLVISLLFSFAPIDEKPEVDDLRCLQQTVSISSSAGSTNSGIITIYQNQTVTLYTTSICTATSYTWTIDPGSASRTTSTNSITISGGDFLWYPAGGCEEFNSHIVDGVYYATLTVQTSISNPYTVQIAIPGVGQCTYPEWPPLELPH